MKTELVLIRHGESVRNLACDRARQGDPAELKRQLREELTESEWALTPRGIEQAGLAGAWVRDHVGVHFEAAVTSPFVRARGTAEGLGLGLDWRIDDRIQEREWGEYDVEEYSTEAYLKHLAECAAFTWRAPFPGAESLADLVPRCRSFLAELLAEVRGHRGIVVSHGGTLRAMQMVLHQLQEGEHASLPLTRMTNGTVLHYELELAADGWHGRYRQAHPAVGGVAGVDWSPL